jgi:uncharacterized membrane protein
MNSIRTAVSIFIGLILCNLAQAGYYWPRLPERVASHFGGSGAPNGWSSRTFFVALYAGIVLLMAAIMAFNAFGLKNFSDARINLPHKDFWLAPARREKTFNWLAAHFLWMGSATMALLLDIFAQAFQFNLGASRALAHPQWTLGVYLVYTAGWLVVLLRRFYALPSDAQRPR